MLTGSPGTNLQLSGAHASNGILGEGPRQLADGERGNGGVWGDGGTGEDGGAGGMEKCLRQE